MKKIMYDGGKGRKKSLLIEMKNKKNWHRINMNVILDVYVI